MPVIHIMSELENLLELHETLNENSKKKTEIIKKGDIESLKYMTGEERKLIKHVSGYQQELMVQISGFLSCHSVESQHPALSDCFDYVNEHEREVLKKLQSRMIKEVSKLKKQNDLNQQLLDQSLAFVNLSLDLITPENDPYNYERPNQNRAYEQGGRSIFDSNA